MALSRTSFTRMMLRIKLSRRVVLMLLEHLPSFSLIISLNLFFMQKISSNTIYLIKDNGRVLLIYFNIPYNIIYYKKSNEISQRFNEIFVNERDLMILLRLNEGKLYIK
jgi:hypothetical protein